MTKRCFMALAGVAELTPNHWQQPTLLIGLGRFGMSSLKHISRFPFLSSWSQLLKNLPTRFPSLESHICTLLSSCKQEGSITHQLQQSLDENINMSEITSNTKKLQHRLTIASY